MKKSVVTSLFLLISIAAVGCSGAAPSSNEASKKEKKPETEVVVAACTQELNDAFNALLNTMRTNDDNGVDHDYSQLKPLADEIQKHNMPETCEFTQNDGSKYEVTKANVTDQLALVDAHKPCGATTDLELQFAQTRANRKNVDEADKPQWLAGIQKLIEDARPYGPICKGDKGFVSVQEKIDAIIASLN